MDGAAVAQYSKLSLGYVSPSGMATPNNKQFERRLENEKLNPGHFEENKNLEALVELTSWRSSRLEKVRLKATSRSRKLDKEIWKLYSNSLFRSRAD